MIMVGFSEERKMIDDETNDGTVEYKEINKY